VNTFSTIPWISDDGIVAARLPHQSQPQFLSVKYEAARTSLHLCTGLVQYRFSEALFQANSYWQFNWRISTLNQIINLVSIVTTETIRTG
jgi:hypothetical protein